MATKQISIKTYSFIADFNMAQVGSISTGLFIPEKTVLVRPSFYKGIISATSAGGGNATFEIGWAGNTAAIFNTALFTSIIQGNVIYAHVAAGDPVASNGIEIPAGGVEILYTIGTDPFQTGQAIFCFQTFEMTL
jgi:hypothetical protein